MPGPTKLHELAARLRATDPRSAAAALAQEIVPGETGPTDRIVALAWATPDLEATVRDVPMPFARSARDRLLDGDTAGLGYGPLLLLLVQPHHPAEGPVGAFLSHYGQGVVAFYLERPRYLPPARASGRPPRPHYTPFGRRGWLLPHEWPWGPFLIVLEDRR